MNIHQMLSALREVRQKDSFCTLLGIGPMSPTLLRAALELSQEQDFPIFFIASRNQVDLKSLGGGYVSGWDQQAFVRAIQSTAQALGYTGQYYICRDHGGPWQRDEERKAALPEAQAMSIGLTSYLADVDAGFDLLHIDPTKDPHISGTLPMDVVLRRTVDLIAQVEAYIHAKGLPPIGYEVGTEETNGGLTGEKEFQQFIDVLCLMLKEKGLPTPNFIVGQTGTLTRLTENIGTYSVDNARRLSRIASENGMELKEHNSDYLPDETLLMHPALGVGSSNVAPEFGVVETQAYLTLAQLEKRLYDEGILAKMGDLPRVMASAAIGTGRWRKWMVGDIAQYTQQQAMADAALCAQIRDISGHYTFEEPAVACEIQALLDNLESADVPARQYVLDKIKASIGKYVTAYHLRGLTSKLRSYTE